MQRCNLATTAVLSLALWTLAGTGVTAQTTPGTTPEPTQPPTDVPAAIQQTAPATTPSPRANVTPTSNSAYPVSHADMKFLEEASQGNTAEIREAQLALGKTKSAEVVRIARRIIADHENAQREVLLIAQANNLNLPKEPNPLQEASYKQLSRLSGAAFDKKYVAAQIQDHTNTINLFHMITEVGNNLEVKQFAKRTMPALAIHAESFRQMARRIGVPATFGRPPASQIAKGMGGMKTVHQMPMNNRTRTTAQAVQQ